MNKARLLLTLAMFLMGSTLVNHAYSAELEVKTESPTADSKSEKSNIKGDSSFLDLANNLIVYTNAVYTQGDMYIKAANMTNSGTSKGLITAQGSPVEIHLVDDKGATTDIQVTSMSYNQVSGVLEASGAISITQRNGDDILRLSGNNLVANPKVISGFNFVLKGSPTEFIIESPEQLPIKATANELRSSGKDKMTELIGDVELLQGNAKMSSAFLLYNGEQRTISAGQSQDGTTQVVSEFYWDTPEPDESETDETDDSQLEDQDQPQENNSTDQ